MIQSKADLVELYRKRAPSYDFTVNLVLGGRANHLSLRPLAAVDATESRQQRS